MKKFPLKTAVIGAGNMGKNHARILSECSELTAVCDAQPKTARVVAAEYDIPFYTNIDELLAKEKLDAVVVAVPTAHHFKAARKVLNAKIPVLVEKPIANSIKEAEALKSLAVKNKTCLMVGHVERFNPVVKHLKKMIDSGRFGAIISLLAIRVGVVPPQAPDSDVAIDLAVHDLDVFNLLLGELPRKVDLIKHKIYNRNAADAASILAHYSKTSAMIQVNWVTPIKIRKVYITGTNLFAELDYINQQIITLNRVVPIPSKNFFELVQLYEGSSKEVYKAKKEPLVEELKYFLQSAQLNKVDTQSIDSAIASLKYLK